jgi:hypothetical protein
MLVILIDGEYEIKVIGREFGNYEICIYADDENLNGTDNEVHSYILKYSVKSASEIELYGTFDGKGQRPRAENRFFL